MSAYVRVRTPVHRTAHLAGAGSSAALCGAAALGDGTWLDGADLPDCRPCANAARVAEAVAAQDSPPGRPGILAVLPRGDGFSAPVGECAECGRLRILKQRGLCQSCARRATADGTIGGYGWTRENRLGEYAGFRRRGLGVPEASARAGVSERTGWRYETALARAGQAQWRAAA